MTCKFIDKNGKPIDGGSGKFHPKEDSDPFDGDGEILSSDESGDGGTPALGEGIVVPEDDGE